MGRTEGQKEDGKLQDGQLTVGIILSGREQGLNGQCQNEDTVVQYGEIQEKKAQDSLSFLDLGVGRSLCFHQFAGAEITSESNS